MNFYYSKVILWCKNGTKREVEFKPNTVNVITGGSGTGKTAILQIIDYCMFASDHKISEDIINENVLWYGIAFFINDKKYTIARQAPAFKEVSTKYYFSSLGEEPKLPSVTDTSDKKIKKIIETDFSIDNSIVMPFGAGGIKKNTRISFRYFMLFNNLPYSVIDSEDVFFGKQNIQRYRDALGRIFELSLGIETIENILTRESKIKLENELEELKKKNENLSIKKDHFHDEITYLFKRAKEFGLIDSSTSTENSVSDLRQLVNKNLFDIKTRDVTKYQSLTKELFLLRKKIDNLKNFEDEYSLYKKNLKQTEDSLQPIMYLNKVNSDLIKTSFFSTVIDSLKQDYIDIKEAIKSKTPINTKVSDLIKTYEEEIVVINKQLAEVPDDIKNFEDNRELYVFLGEIKAKTELFYDSKKTTLPQGLKTVDEIESQLSKLNLFDITEKRKLTINLLEEFIQENINFVKDALDNYGFHKAAFNFKEKKLELRQPKSDKVVNTGSSSIDMFLHILMFLGLHKVIMEKKVPYIAPYLIMDQPSKPYYGENDDNYKDVKETDKYKIEHVFKLLNNFMSEVVKENMNFQMIVFEHVPKEMLEGMAHIHLVEEFRNGNALMKRENKVIID